MHALDVDAPIIDKYFVQNNINGTNTHVRILNGFFNGRDSAVPTPLHFYQPDEQDKLGINPNSFDWERGNKYCEKVLVCFNVSLEKGNQESNLSFLFDLLRKNYYIDLSRCRIWSPSFILSFENRFNQFYQDEFLSGARICLDLPELPREFRNLSNSFWSRKSFSEDIYQKITDALE